MYAFILHAHQKIDRVALRHLKTLAGTPVKFPSQKEILHFEGKNGPDASKFKGTVDEQPWHFIDPFDPHDTNLHGVIGGHYDRLVKALKDNNRVRASFEAAWLAHALVDGLTPPHHFPYEAELERLRGEQRHSRTTLKDRAIVKGETPSESLRRSYELVGPKGLLTTHTVFEAGAYMILAPSRLQHGLPTEHDIDLLHELGVIGYFQRMAREVAALDMFNAFRRTGWTPKLARQVRRELAPRMVKTVTIAWYAACIDAKLVAKKDHKK
ncbi:MAG TPA: hypothetical protein VMR45_01575 [Patescibacteria group bacterium]|nr:hypothetical protein [Patescibacteria group bacterium]